MGNEVDLSSLDLKALAASMMGGGSGPRDDKKYQRGNNSTNYQGSQRTNNRSNFQGGQRTNTSNQGQRYAGAPYNFVPFSEKVYEYPEGKLTAHDDVSEELLTGEIEYEIKAETPIIVSDGKDWNGIETFHKNARGDYAIPGSTLRGLIRSNVQVLGLGSFYDDVDDYSMMYRAVAPSTRSDKFALKERYNGVLGAKLETRIVDGKRRQFSVLKNVKAGYIQMRKGRYEIVPTIGEAAGGQHGEMNYYLLSEREVVDDYLDSQKGKKFHYGFFMQDGKSIMQHEFQPFYKEGEGRRTTWVGTANKNYKPYSREISFSLKGRKVVAVGRPGEYEQEGVAVSTGAMRNKKVIYIIPQMDENAGAIEIPEEDVRAFQIDYENRKNTLPKKEGTKEPLEYFQLPKEGKKAKPVFYIQLDRTYFGFTPRLRLFYDRTVKEGMPKSHRKEPKVDYSRAIFGYSEKGKKASSYRSKVSFTDAVVIEDIHELPVEKRILGEPKSTSFMDYLVQDRGHDAWMTYNNEEAKLRGIKQYWLRDEVVPGTLGKNENVASSFKPLAAGTVFCGKVRFKNMTKDELGLLLWSMALEEGYWMNVGKAKGFGFGNISLSVKSVRCLDKAMAYRSEGLELEPWKGMDMKECIKEYQDTINQWLGNVSIESLPSIQDFFAMKDPLRKPDKEKIRYMDMNKKEYQNRDKPLGTVQELAKKPSKR